MLKTSLFRGEGSLKQNRTTADGGRDLLFNINSRYPLCKYLPVLKKMADAEQPEPAEDFLFKGKRLDCKKKIFGGGFFLFDGYWKENENAGAEKERVKSKTSNLKKEAAIRRIKNEDCLDGWKDVADKLVKGNLNHNNILRVFGYEEDVANGWRYFALEPYSATLYEYCTGRYKGAMPNQSQVLYQITNGIFYLHGKGIVHGDLNPLNVVIAAQSHPVRMKISDFGLSKFSYGKQLSEREDNISSEVKLCLRKYWTLSEETDSLEGIKDATEDVIATGCILFYYLKRGKYLFGNDSNSILKNLKENNPVNLETISIFWNVKQNNCHFTINLDCLESGRAGATGPGCFVVGNSFLSLLLHFHASFFLLLSQFRRLQLTSLL
ncbi:hypothetical protein OUZ56_006197 [Daphnia magna]|uniref:Protein kinase domain-containing protein n=1 Tax=Daphnia magna TaxID=35525 RepID=A0ABQ9YUY0_9CRUS|nr:hypothetical protein OUZ56_006197 [Daphnia magna]